MSNILNKKHALAKLRAELERRRGKLYRYCKGFRHLAYNCRNKRERRGKLFPKISLKYQGAA